MQKGFLPGRRMVDHAPAAVDCWNQSGDCIFVGVDFAKAYDLVQPPFIEATLLYIGLPLVYVRLLVHLMQSPLVVEVCGEVQLDVRIHP